MSDLHPLHASQITNARRQGATQEILIKVPSYIRLEYKVSEWVNELLPMQKQKEWVEIAKAADRLEM